MTVILCLLTSLLALAFLFIPFFIGPGGALSPHSAFINEDALQNVRKSLLAQYVKCEDLFTSGQISKREWEQRQLFLRNRFLDASRRLDRIRFQQKESAGEV